MTEREPCPIHKPAPCSFDCPNSPHAHVQRELRHQLAEAWDAGWLTAAAQDRYEHTLDPRRWNPYREEQR